MEKFFKLKENGTTLGREVTAGLTTFFAMAYIIAVNPTLLAESGMEWGAVFLATILASIAGTLVMGLVANVPYAQAPAWGSTPFLSIPSAAPWTLPGSRPCPWCFSAASSTC